METDALRCWKCRKYIASSACLIKCHGREPSKTPQLSDAAQETCNVWHMNLEAIPEWVKCVIEKAQWTIGKLHCPFCEARLGGFNFVCNTKCSCGQSVNIHFCKSRTDYQAAFAVKVAKPSAKHLTLCKIKSDFNTDPHHKVLSAALEIKNQGFSYMARNYNGSGRLTEALCLEVRSPSFKMKSKNLPPDALKQRQNPSAAWPVNGACTVKAFHRRSRSLDLNIRESLVLLPALYVTSSVGTICCGQNENPPVYTRCDLQLGSSQKGETAFQGQYSSNADELRKRFQVTSFNALVHREIESECDFEAPGQYSGSAIVDQSPFAMNLSSSTSAVEEERHVVPVGPVQPANISLNQKLSKRERNKLKSLRRKQKRRERWLQKQTANDNLHTDDEHEFRGDKESYLCAVCLDLYFNPYMCYPCHHIFCEPCLRTLAKDNPASTPCPLCRTTIARVFFQAELNNSTKSFFPTEYLKLKESFQKSNSAKWPLPSCKKAFRVFEAGFQRRSATVTRRHFPHAAHRMDYMDFEDDSRGWRFDMDMVIIYIYSVNWVIGFIVFCFLCYFFFPF
ncbi:PREDICTED: E3 ubiquitin-protein ligase RNF180 [Tinamus guttatus]|uniref:E3 ubiquitin-protein ligase RNF180 n=1 Tax=Tinamus guttatus TaxID=94827 RepID=UPI00052E86BD|nr:PREDICTED: E3 ubiquitin-protein ligase RNF180 [Tinamus guttatus]